MLKQASNILPYQIKQSRGLYKNHHQIKFQAKQHVLGSVEDHTFAMIFQLGDNGMNKMVGELDLLYDYLRDACTSKKASSGHKDKKNKESSKL